MQDTKSMHILALDDDAQDAELLQRHLERVPELECTFHHVQDPMALTNELQRNDVDVIFLDYQLGGETGLDVLDRVRACGYLGPVIVLTGHGDEYLAAQLVRSGADDYIAKADLDPERLLRAIRNGNAQHAQRLVSAENRELVSELTAAKRSLEDRNQRLSELYRTAHQFVDDVSHEFRTPLTVVKDFATILRDGIAGPVNEEQCEYLDIIVNRVDDLVTMVGDMLDVSKIEAGKLGVSRHTTTIAEIFERVQPALERRAKLASVALEVDVPEKLPEIYCDAEKVGRVIINLVVNAIKFSGKDGGEVRLWAKSEAPGDEILVGVSDNGPGIPEKSLEEIFERFRQVDGNFKGNIKGFGLGLSISKQLVQLNFGRMRVETEEGAGSTFSFSIPAASPVALIDRYLETAVHLRDGSTFVSLVSVVGESGDGQADALVSAFLQSATRHTDLLFGGDGRWLLVLAMMDRDARRVVARLEGARERWNERNPGEELPNLRFRSLGTWRIGARNDDLVRCFKTLWNGHEVSRAIMTAAPTTEREDPSLERR